LHFLKKAVDDETVHVEPAKCEALAAAYVMLKGSCVGPFYEIGTLGVKGGRSDLKNAAALVAASSSLRPVAEQFPDVYVRNYRGLASLQQYHRKPAQRKVEVFVLAGETGTGKSRWAYHHYGDKLYTVPEPSTQYWFDGYIDQPVVLFDDYDGAAKITQLLKWLDTYPVDLPVKGSFAAAAWTTVIITSNLTVDEWYPHAKPIHLQALKRRITRSVWLEGDDRTFQENEAGDVVFKYDNRLIDVID